MNIFFSSQAIIMNEGVDKIRDKKCTVRRNIIRKALSHPADSTLRPHSSLSRDIAFAQSVILPGFIGKKAARTTQERCKVIKEMVNELKNPSFEERIRIAASTVNPDEKTRDLNAKGYHKRSVSFQESVETEIVRFLND